MSRTDPHSSNRGRFALVGALVAAAGICYSSWVLAFSWPGQLDPLRTFLSELDAAHRPHRAIYVGGDVITGVCALLAALAAVIPRPLVSGRIAWTAIAGFAAFGAATIADALLPIECIPGVDRGCPREPSGMLPQLHHIHALTSTLAVFAIFATMIAATATALRSGTWPLLRIAGTTVVVIVVATTAWMLIADNLSGDHLLGLAQRIQVGGMSVWLLLWGAAFIRTPTRRHRRSMTDAAGRSS